MIKEQQIWHALALLEFRNFRKAAHAENISQPAFSRSIAKLEEALGVKPFHRHPYQIENKLLKKIVSKRRAKIN